MNSVDSIAPGRSPPVFPPPGTQPSAALGTSTWSEWNDVFRPRRRSATQLLTPGESWRLGCTYVSRSRSFRAPPREVGTDPIRLAVSWPGQAYRQEDRPRWYGRIVTNADDGEQRLSAGKGRRLVIIVVCAALVVGTTKIVRFVGNRRVAHEVARIRQRASTARVEPALLLSPASGGGTDPIAEALATDATTREIHGLDASWCAQLEVQRLISKRSVYFMISASGQLVETANCKK